MGLFGSKAKPNDQNFKELTNDDRMNKAYELAQRSIIVGVGAMTKGIGETLSVKTRFSENGKVEHAWVTVNSIMEDCFGGVIANDLEYCTKQKCGDVVVVKHADLTDWMCVLKGNGKILGSFTLRASWPSMKEAEKAELRLRLMKMPHDDELGISIDQ